MSTVAKVAGGTTVLGGGIGGAGYSAYSHYNTTIEESLKSEFKGFSLLNTDSGNVDESKWDILIKSYWQSEFKKKEGADFISSSEASGTVTEGIRKEFKDKCKQLKETVIGFGDVASIKQTVKDWCTEINTIEVALKREGRKLLEGDSFKSVFESNKNETSFKAFLNKSGETLTLGNHLSEHKNKCSQIISNVPSDTDLKNARDYCVEKSST